MKCSFCDSVATEKHHIRYFPEQTIGVCSYHGDHIHLHPDKYASVLKYRAGDALIFYNQSNRIKKFCMGISKAQRFAMRRKS